jgi:hypothetical protein
MATWRAIRSSRQNRKQDKHDSIEQAFRAEWLHGHFLGRARPPFRGTFSPPCTFLISLMIDGVVASLPVKGSPCSSARGLHPNGFFSRDSQGGVPKLS